ARADVWRVCRAQPDALAAALEEWLRYDPPLRFVHLIAGEACAESGVAPGDSVLVALDAANRDPVAFDAPDNFLPDRRAQHLAFGSGPLTCIGSAFARMLARAAIGRLVAMTEPSEQAGLAFPMIRLVRRA